MSNIERKMIEVLAVHIKELERNCGHRACTCQAREHSSYCTDECEQAVPPPIYACE